LLKDRSSGKNIIWAIDNYAMRGLNYESQMPKTVKLISGRFGKVIRPQIDKSQKDWCVAFVAMFIFILNEFINSRRVLSCVLFLV